MQGHDPVKAKGAERWPATSFDGGAGALGAGALAPVASFTPSRRQRCPRWFVGACIGCLLLAGGVSAAFATAALWQLGNLVDELVDFARATPAAVASPPPPLRRLEPTPRPPPSSVAATPPPLGSAPLRAPVAPTQTFEAEAEASEKIVPLGVEPEPEPEPTYRRTECSDVFVYIVSISEGLPAASAASLAVGKTSPARFKRPGQSIGDWEVLAITDDWSGANPGVWLLKDNAICRAELAGNPARVHVPLKQVRKPKVTRRRRRRARR